MRERSIPFMLSGTFRRLAWTEWGPGTGPVLVCVHGLTRQGRDFDALAQHLAGWRVVCPDLPGRGRSDWLDAQHYAVPSYLVALAHLLAAIDAPVCWLGTSLGGICGMVLASMPGNPITRLVLNDIGPHIPAAALARIRDYLAEVPTQFPDLAAVEAQLRRVHAPFGQLGDAQWAQMARHSARPLPGGGFALHYDPAIAAPILASEPQDVDLWAAWGAIRVPRLVLRGAESDLLQPATLARMAAEGAATHTVPECGHAPALLDVATMEVVRRFLEPC